MTISLRPTLRAALLGALGCAALAMQAQAAEEITGAGSTAIYPALAKWATTYEAATGVKLNYQSIGSGGGIQQIEAKTVTFGASDAPLAPADLGKNGLIQWPGVVFGAAITANLPGITAGELKLTGSVLADIYLGKITKWNDPAIAGLNPSVKLPATPIAVVHRSDGSGTTFLFTNYLAQSNADWKSKVGAATAVDWPVGIGGKGSEGVTGFANQTPGSIAYVEYTYAAQNKLTTINLEDSTGAEVAPNLDSFTIAAAGADWAHADGFNLVLTSQPAKGAWPITGGTFIMIQTNPPKPDDAAAALKFFDWTFKNGGDAAKSLYYVGLPTNVVSLIESSWSNIKGADGKPIWTGK